MVQSPSSPQLPQNVAVVIRISAGSFTEGFPLLLQILEDGQIIREYDDLPAIPAAPEMQQLYRQWQEISLENSRVLQAVPGQATNVSYADWRQTTTELREYCNTWFRHTAFSSLRDRIRANARVRADQSVPIIIRCFTTSDKENDILRRLPWHLWDLFSQSQLPNAEFALFTNYRRRVAILEAPIRVLAIFGSSDGGLQLKQDEAALQILEQRGAEIIRISEPSPETLSRLLCNENWDILFFAGHSSSQENSGTIQISQGNSLPLDALRQSLTRAVRRGLKLAIFNSCDGLGIADFLTGLNVPAVIVMREPVPDRIAGKFLVNLLKEFSQGTPLFLAVREARESLEGIEFRDFPAASWLPVICVNPNQPELVWPTPIPEPTPPPPPPPLPPPQPLWRRLLSNVRDFITRFLVSPVQSLLLRLRSFFSRYYLIVLGFAAFALVVIMAVGRPIACQIFPSICIENFISYGEKPIANSIVNLRGLSEEYRLLKKEGIKAFHLGDYPKAVKNFDDLRNLAQKNKNAKGDIRQAALVALQDPEILIYRNNAFVNDPFTKNPNSPIYTIAVAAPLNLDAGLHILFGVAQAQDVAVKQEKINLKVVIANDKNEPEQARRIAEKLYDDDKIIAVVGHYTSENTCVALNVYSQKRNPLVVISPTSSVVNLPYQQDCGKDANLANQVFFRTVSTTQVEVESLLTYLINELNKSSPKVVIFYNNQQLFSNDLVKQFEDIIDASKFQGRIIDKFKLDENLDTNKLPDKVKNAVKEADALAVLPDGQTSSNRAFNKAINIINWNNGKKPILGANTLYLKDVINQIKDTKSLFLAVDWHQHQCGAKDFAQQINNYWGGDSNLRTALAYEAVQAVLQPMKQLQPMKRRDIQNKLSDTKIGNPQDIKNVAALSDTIKSIQNLPILPISFESNGDRHRESTMRAIVKVNKKVNDNHNLNEEFQLDLVKDVPCPK